MIYGFCSENKRSNIYHKLRKVVADVGKTACKPHPDTTYNASDKSAKNRAKLAKNLSALFNYPVKTGNLRQTTQSGKNSFKTADSNSNARKTLSHRGGIDFQLSDNLCDSSNRTDRRSDIEYCGHNFIKTACNSVGECLYNTSDDFTKNISDFAEQIPAFRDNPVETGNLFKSAQSGKNGCYSAYYSGDAHHSLDNVIDIRFNSAQSLDYGRKRQHNRDD